MSHYRPSQADIDQFHADGYLFVPNLLSQDEVELLTKVARADRDMDNANVRKDASGGESRLRLRNELHDDMYSAIARSRRVADTMEALLGDEVYHYHHKMMLKEPRVGGAWEWHQDYGYWYNNYLYPDMGSCMIAVDRATRENGCLQVVRGSHKIGRVEHGKFGDQTGADPARVEAAMNHLEHVYAEMEPGTALFFHANTLHRSDANTSEHPRWTLICCYNTKHNVRVKEGGHPSYSPLERWDDDKVLETGKQQWQQLQPAS